MTSKMTLLAAVAAIALPAAMAGAQTDLPADSTPPTTGAAIPPAEDAPPPTNHHATEDAQDEANSAQPAPATTPDPVNENAEPGTTPTQTPPPPPQQPSAPNEPQAQAQTPGPAATGPTVLASAADIRAGVPVVDQAGGTVGTIKSVDATGAVVSTGTIRAKLPLTSFGRNNQGLVISMTRAQLEAAAEQATPSAG